MQPATHVSFGNQSFPIPQPEKHEKLEEIQALEALTLESFTTMLKTYFALIKDEQQDHAKNYLPQHEIDGFIAETLTEELVKKGSPLLDRRAMAEIIASIGRLSLIEAAKDIWKPVLAYLDSIGQFVLCTTEGSFSTNLEGLKHLDSKVTIPEKWLKLILVNMIVQAIQKKEYEQLEHHANEFNRFAARLDFNEFKLELFQILAILPYDVRIDLKAKQHLNAFFETFAYEYVQKNHSTDFFPFVLTVRLMGFLSDCERITLCIKEELANCYSHYKLNYCNPLEKEEESYFKGEPQARDIVRLIELTFGHRSADLDALPGSEEFQTALNNLFQMVFMMPFDAMAEWFIPILQKTFTYNPRLSSFFLNKLVTEYQNVTHELTISNEMLEELVRPLIASKDAGQYYEFIMSLLICACKNIAGNKFSNLSYPLFQKIVEHFRNLLKKINVRSVPRIKDQFQEALQEAGKHIFKGYLAELDPAASIQSLGKKVGLDIPKVAVYEIIYKDPELEKLIDPIAQYFPIDYYYGQLTQGIYSSTIALNPSTIWFLSEYFAKSKIKLEASQAQIFYNRVFIEKNVDRALMQNSRENPLLYYFKLFADLKAKHKDLEIDPNVLLKVIHNMKEEIYQSPDSHYFIAIADFLIPLLISEASPLQTHVSPKGILKKDKKIDGFPKSPTRIRFGESNVFRFCTTLERWLKAAEGIPLPDVSSRVKLFAEYLTKNCPVNLNVFACAESIFSHYPKLAMQIIRNGLESRLPVSTNSLDASSEELGLKYYVESLLDGFEKYASLTDLNYDEWNLFAKKVLMAPGLTVREQNFLREMYKRLERMFPRPTMVVDIL